MACQSPFDIRFYCSERKSRTARFTNDIDREGGLAPQERTRFRLNKPKLFLPGRYRGYDSEKVPVVKED